MMIRTIYDGKQKVQKKDEKNHNEFLAACENFLWQKKKILAGCSKFNLSSLQIQTCIPTIIALVSYWIHNS